MNTFKRKALFTAVVAGLGAAGTAEAVYLSPNSLGQVLVFPYYSANNSGGNAWNTYLSIVNTTSRAKAVKVRILEGKASAEVLDFNLFLSPNDMWVAAISPVDSTNASSGGQIATTDVSCTNPGFSSGVPVPFRNFQYSPGSNGNNLPGTGLDRTREGYVEMIEMGLLSGSWATAVTHNSAGIPNNCAVVQVNTAPPSITAPGGGLAGTGTLINVASGIDAGYKADALDAWSTATQFTTPGSVSPNLASATPAISTVLNVGGTTAAGNSALATIYRTDWTAVSGVVAGARAVAAVYMHTDVINEYILDAATLSNTDWVITQPLKNIFVTDVTAATPYTNVMTSSGACETISFTFFNREERGASAGGTDFSPTPPSAPANTLCWESNVLSIRNTGLAQTQVNTSVSGVLGSFNVTNVNVTAGNTFQNGWAQLHFTGTNASAPNGMSGAAATSDRTAVSNVAAIAAGTASAQTFFGLPVTGFMIRTLRNNNQFPCLTTAATPTCAQAYATLFNHSYHTLIAP
jgi:hypothetical protein